MRISDVGPSLVTLFSEPVDGAPGGAPDGGDAFMLNSGDPGLLERFPFVRGVRLQADYVKSG